MILRKHSFINTPVPAGIRLLHPEQYIIRIGSSTLDVGALCYAERELESNRSTTVNLVDDDTLLKSRIKSVRVLIRYISDHIEHGSTKEVSVFSKLRNFKTFVDWSDLNGHNGVLDSFELAQNALYQYVVYLQERVSTDGLNNNTAARYQYDAIIVLRDCFSFDGVETGINIIKKSKSSITNTSPPDEAKQGVILSLAMSLFEGVYDLVIRKKDYPYSLKLPEFVGHKNNRAWMFPTNPYTLSPDRIQNNHYGKAYNYKTGTLNTADEIGRHYKSITSARKAVIAAEEVIERSNAYDSKVRIDHSFIALNAFMVLFSANTGMNWSQLSDLLWSDDYEVGVDMQGFREIKYRANNKPVTFIVTTSFLPIFKRYLELRDYVTKSFAPSNILFFSKGRTKKSLIKISNPKLSLICRSFRLFYPDCPTINSMEWRAAKSDFLVRNTDIHTASVILQSSEKTVLDHYTKGSETGAITELSCFLERVVDTSGSRRIKNKQTIALSTGSCGNPGNPEPELDSPIEPDCKKGEGCLFCNNYVVHANEGDVRKLYSCMFCIDSTKHLSGSPELFDEFFGGLLKRIESILSYIGEVSKKHGKLIIRVRNEVFDDGELDPYWEAKYEQLLNLGIID